MDDIIVESMIDRFAAGIDVMPPEVLETVKLHVADSIACALASRDGDAVKIAQAVSRPEAGSGARVIGEREPASLESAAFTNTTMIRYLDLNDSYNAIGSGHPSDLIGTSLAAATQAGRTGADVITSVDAAYDCLTDLWDQTRIGRDGWDQGTMIGPVAAAIAGTLLGLDGSQTAEAISMSAVSGVAVRQTRRGHLSMWKGMATAHASAAAVSAVQLAKHGATGPPQPFVGVNALGELLFTADPAPISARGAILRANLKRFPCCYHAQGPIEIAAAARRTVDPETVTAIDVDVYEKALIDLALDEEKWHPKIRESADHSLPFLVAVGLLDAGLTETSFSDDRWLHADVDELMQKVRVKNDPQLTEAFPKEVSSRVRISYGDGQEFTDSVSHPLGHYLRPMPAEQVRDKFLAVTGPWIGPDRADVLYGLLMRLEEVQDLSEVMDLTIVNP